MHTGAAAHDLKHDQQPGVLAGTALALDHWHDLLANVLHGRRGPAPNSAWKKLVLELKVHAGVSTAAALPVARNSLAEVLLCAHRPGELVGTMNTTTRCC